MKYLACIFVALLFLMPGKSFGQKQKLKYSDDELLLFTEVFKNLQKAEEKSMDTMLLLVENNGLTMKRFNEIHLAFRNPSIQGNTTPTESKKHQKIMLGVQKIQAKLQQKMDSIVKASEMSLRKYKRIVREMQTNTSLRKRYISLQEKKSNPNSNKEHKE